MFQFSFLQSSFISCRLSTNLTKWWRSTDFSFPFSPLPSHLPPSSLPKWNSSVSLNKMETKLTGRWKITFFFFPQLPTSLFGSWINLQKAEKANRKSYVQSVLPTRQIDHIPFFRGSKLPVRHIWGQMSPPARSRQKRHPETCSTLKQEGTTFQASRDLIYYSCSKCFLGLQLSGTKTQVLRVANVPSPTPEESYQWAPWQDPLLDSKPEGAGLSITRCFPSSQEGLGPVPTSSTSWWTPGPSFPPPVNECGIFHPGTTDPIHQSPCSWAAGEATLAGSRW